MTTLDSMYKLHTGRELEFMLTRGKPLAHFCDYYPPEPCEEVVPQGAFEPHVASGRFVARAYVQLKVFPPPYSIRGTLHVFYALPSDDWRIDRYIEMQAEGEQQGWSEKLERLQGSLLGYTEAENDLHIERALSNPALRNWPWVRMARQARGVA